MGNLAKLIAENGPLPATLEAQSASGGRHFFFKWPTDGLDIKSRSGKIAAGIDVKATNGIVVLAPTRMAHGSYSWVNDLPIAPAPEWLIALARRDNHRHRGNGGDHSIEFPDGEPDAEVDLDKLAFAMTALPNMSLDEVGGDTEDPRYFDYDRWLAVLMACHRSFGGGAEGFDIVDAWTEKNPDQHDKRHITAEIWKGFNDNSGPVLRSKVREITAATVYHFANLAAPGWDAPYHAEAERRTEEANANDDLQMADDRGGARRRGQVTGDRAGGGRVRERRCGRESCPDAEPAQGTRLIHGRRHGCGSKARRRCDMHKHQHEHQQRSQQWERWR